MPRVPFVGRLFFREYLALVGSFVFIGLELFIRIITLALPFPVIKFFYNRSRTLFNSLSSPQSKRSRTKKKTLVTNIRDASDFVDLCALFGYYAEEHVVQTTDGYLLGLHRLGWRRGEEGSKVNCGEDSIKKPVVYLHHGLLMNSEVWVCLTEKERCLPFALLERGYDVWLGNNRGNKYSKKSTLYSPTSNRFWDFSMDQFAFHDIPDSINYILSTTRQPSLSFIGFSQGTAQAFAALAIHPSLNEKIDVFIALAPAMSPAGLRNGIVDALVKASPEVIFLAFGRRMILSSTTTWQALLYPPIFVRIIDTCLEFLFGWTGRNIPPHQKLAAYAHLYSFTSTKSVVHWFQIIRTKSFQMYDDEVQAPFSLSSSSGRYYKVAKFPTRNIKTPIVLVYGGSDSLVDIKVMLKELPRHTIAKEIPHFEHLDFLWAAEVDSLVFPHVFDALDAYAARDHSKRLPSSFNGRYITAGSLDSEDERFGGTTVGASSGDAGADGDVDHDSDIMGRESTRQASETSTPSRIRGTPFPTPSARRKLKLQNPPLRSSESTPESNHAHSYSSDISSPGVLSHSTLRSSKPFKTQSPSSTDATADSASESKHHKKPRRSSQSSSKSSENLQKAGVFGEGGIALGTAKAVGGDVDRKGAKGLVGQEREPILASHKRQRM